MPLEIRETQVPAQSFVGVRRVVKHDGLGPLCGEVLPRVANWLKAQGIHATSPPLMVYFSVDEQSGDFDCLPGFFVAVPVEPEGDIVCGETAEGDALVATHVGPYTSLGESWGAMFARAAELGRSVTNATWELYVDDPGNVSDAELRTEIYVPLD